LIHGGGGREVNRTVNPSSWPLEDFQGMSRGGGGADCFEIDSGDLSYEMEICKVGTFALGFGDVEAEEAAGERTSSAGEAGVLWLVREAAAKARGDGGKAAEAVGGAVLRLALNFSSERQGPGTATVAAAARVGFVGDAGGRRDSARGRLER